MADVGQESQAYDSRTMVRSMSDATSVVPMQGLHEESGHAGEAEPELQTGVLHTLVQAQRRVEAKLDQMDAYMHRFGDATSLMEEVRRDVKNLRTAFIHPLAPPAAPSAHVEMACGEDFASTSRDSYDLEAPPGVSDDSFFYFRLDSDGGKKTAVSDKSLVSASPATLKRSGSHETSSSDYQLVPEAGMKKTSSLASASSSILKSPSNAPSSPEYPLGPRARLRRSSCSGSSLASTTSTTLKAPGDSRSNGPNRIQVKVDSAQLARECANDGLNTLCRVSMDDAMVMETSIAVGCSPEWNAGEACPYRNEEVLVFTVLADDFGVRKPLGTASLQLRECLCRGFSGSLQLTSPGVATKKSVVGKLTVTVGFEYMEQPSPSASETSRNVRFTQEEDTGCTDSITSTMRGKMSGRASSRLSRRGSIQWPATIGLREGIASFDENQAGGTVFFGEDLDQIKWAVRRNMSHGDSMDESTSMSSYQRSRRRKRCRRSCVMSPLSMKMLVWDVLSLLMLFHDFLTIPFVLAWDDRVMDGWFAVSVWCSFLFWMTDVFVQLMTGYFEDGQVEMRWFLVVRHYFKTWFWLDVPLVCLDMVSAIGGLIAFQGSRDLRISKIFRLLRIISLVRVWRLIFNVSNVLERYSNDSLRALTYIFKLVMVIIWIGHVVCCAWYWIGKASRDATGSGWFDTIEYMAGGDDVHFVDASWHYQYSTSFHWALGQISGSGVETICPANTYERVFNIFICIFQILFGTFLVSSLSATMIEVQMSKQEKLQKVRSVRQFLCQNHIDPQLSIRVQKQLSERLGSQKRLSADEVPALQILSRKIRMELQYEIFGPHILKHPLYNMCSKIDDTAVQCFCYEAVQVTTCPPGEVIFLPGTEAENCYLLIRGQVNYTMSPISFAYLETQEEVTTKVQEGQWMCRAALWSAWQHVGTAEANKLSDLLVISAKCVLDTMLKHPIMGDILREYGTQFHTRLMSAAPPHAKYPNDLEVSFTTYKELVLAMKSEIRVIIGMVALSKLRKERTWFTSPAGLQRLESELVSGKSTVLVSEHGNVERVVALSTLRLESGDGRMLTQVGRYVDGQLMSRPGLPGTAIVDNRELPGDAIERLLDNDLEPFKRDLRWHPSKYPSQITETRESPAYGIMTEYIKTVHHAYLEDEAVLIPPECRHLKNSRPYSQPQRTSGKSNNSKVDMFAQPPIFRQTTPSNNPGLPYCSPSNRNLSANVAMDLKLCTDVFQIDADNKDSKVFAWLLPDEFEYVCRPENNGIVQHWLESFEKEDEGTGRRLSISSQSSVFVANVHEAVQGAAQVFANGAQPLVDGAQALANGAALVRVGLRELTHPCSMQSMDSDASQQNGQRSSGSTRTSSDLGENDDRRDHPMSIT